MLIGYARVSKGDDQSTGQYIIGTQVYGRLYLKKRMSFSLHKRAFVQAIDRIHKRVPLRLS